MNIAELKTIIAAYPDDAPVILMSKSKHKKYDDAQGLEHLVVNDDGDWFRASRGDAGIRALVLEAAG